ncbi:MAG: hypothetical protein Q9160_006992 [Pyrenula sp. 1 TL-2023]
MPRDTSPSLDDSRLTENDTVEDHWASPSTKQNTNHAHNDTHDAIASNDGQTMFEKEAAREASLRAELASVRKVNEAIEGMVESLNKAQSNMKVCGPYFYVGTKNAGEPLRSEVTFLCCVYVSHKTVQKRATLLILSAGSLCLWVYKDYKPSYKDVNNK